MEFQLLLGAQGYVSKGDDPRILLKAVRKVVAGDNFISPQLAEAVMGRPLGSEREAAAGLGISSTPIQGAPVPHPSPIISRGSAILLEAVDLACLSDRARPALRGLSFNIRRGEILGVAGVDGNGQGELAEVLTGLRKASGTLRLDGRDRFQRTPAAARAAGVVHLPEDRHRRALCLPLSVEENFALGRQRNPPYARGVLIDKAGRRDKALQLVRDFDVRPPDPLARAGDLSGGNQQKLVAARELAGGAPPRLVVAVQPTRGLDLGASRRVHDALRQARDDGAAVLLISLDLDELRAVGDRILVLYDGRATGEAGPGASDDELGRLMLGATETAAHA